eukprot:Protomagalhaensia_wolfi_Nauph_80__2213@NODE_2432_length_1093_cov_3_889943_g1905_i0_p1_GENE_NODE_2432_length_1093_cov_3_889943_g1905_i0NODE_2432_length_1093_cov_3_889943_g1905_i0_p1_ORF_typecomplete_len339_score24_79zfRING_5/PF14634_6/1_1ProkRING_4/PF14447_6/26_NODE_2432_length_1093_cov_3_889943_g1905_i0601076
MSYEDDDVVMLEGHGVSYIEAQQREYLRISAWWRKVLTRARDFRENFESQLSFQVLNDEEKLDAFIAHMPAFWIDDTPAAAEQPIEWQDVKSESDVECPSNLQEPDRQSYFADLRNLEDSSSESPAPPHSSAGATQQSSPAVVEWSSPASVRSSPEALPTDQSHSDAGFQANRGVKLTKLENNEVGLRVPYYVAVWDVAPIGADAAVDEVVDLPQDCAFDTCGIQSPSWEGNLGPRPTTLGSPFVLGDPKSLNLDSLRPGHTPLVEELARTHVCYHCRLALSHSPACSPSRSSSIPPSRFHILPCGHPLCIQCRQRKRVECVACKRDYNTNSCYPLFV